MPVIKSSTDLRNKYNEISEFCNKYREPVFITKNGQGDLAVMSIEMYERLSGKIELYQLLAESAADVKAGRIEPFEDVMQELERKVERIREAQNG